MINTWRSHLSLFAVCWIWGLAFIATKAVLDDASFVTVNMARFMIASLSLLPFILAFRGRRPELSNVDRARILLAGICAVYGYHLAVTYGETLIPAGTAGLLANTTPIFAAVLANVFLGEKVGLWRAGGIVFALGGVAVITADHGNAERMVAEDGITPFTAHSTNDVPLCVVADGLSGLASSGILADVAPTLAMLVGLDAPDEWTGRSLLVY